MLCLASCASTKENPWVVTMFKDSAEIEFMEIAAIYSTSMSEDATEIGNFLESNNIYSTFEGSTVYAIYVPLEQAPAAIRLLKEEPRFKKKGIEIHEMPKVVK